MPALSIDLDAEWANMPTLSTSAAAPWSDMPALSIDLNAEWAIYTKIAASLATHWQITAIDPLHSELLTRWALPHDPAAVTIAYQPTITDAAGKIIPIHSAEITADEGSSLYRATLKVAKLSDYIALRPGDSISITLFDETYNLIIDAKAWARSEIDAENTLSAISPLALLDAPWSAAQNYSNASAIDAQAAAENILGQPIDWQLPAWTIPAGALTISGATPLSAVKTLCAEIGGTLESAPDGSAIARKLHPVSPPDYASATPDIALAESDIYAISVQTAETARENRISIGNSTDAAATSSKTEFTFDEDSKHTGTVRAWPTPWRTCRLAHTGHPSMQIVAQGERIAIEEELIEFVGGYGQADHPIHSIQSAVWQYTPLGDVTYNGQQRTASSKAESLLKLTYTTRTQNWRITAPETLDESVQFVLFD